MVMYHNETAHFMNNNSLKPLPDENPGFTLAKRNTENETSYFQHYY